MVWLVVWLLLWPGWVGQAQGRYGIDIVESIFGATNISLVTGHGRLTVGISRDGDLSVLLWPNPSHGDQLGYLTSNALDAREKPRFGAPESAGMVLGLLLEKKGGERSVVWLRDKKWWKIKQSYGPSNGPNPQTVFTGEKLGLTVTLTDAVAPPQKTPRADLLVRHLRVVRQAKSEVRNAWLLTYANLSPMPPNAFIEKLPLADWIFDGRNDFAALWDKQHKAIVHFHPKDQLLYNNVLTLLSMPKVDFGPVGKALSEETVKPEKIEQLVASLDKDYSPGSYLLLSTQPAPEQHHIGFDETKWCAHLEAMGERIRQLPQHYPHYNIPLPDSLLQLLKCPEKMPDYRKRDGWKYQASSAWSDVADGELSGGGIAAGEVDEALRTPLSFQQQKDGSSLAEASVWLSIGETLSQAREGLKRFADASKVAAAAEDTVKTWLKGQRLPQKGGEKVRQVARRSLINLRVGTDAATGTIVASISRQPAYGNDWPRDGAFFNVLLDIAGQHKLVERRIELYAKWQRKVAVKPTLLVDAKPPPNPDGTPGTEFPAGGFEMCYYPNGKAGGIFRFEIDTTAFAIWTIVAHVGWVAPEKRKAYLSKYWETIELGTDLLASWRDPKTGLQALAREDDSGEPTQTIHGAGTVFGALEIASRAARLLGKDKKAQSWEERAAELRKAIVEHFYDAKKKRFVMGETARAPYLATQTVPLAPTAWIVWPMKLLSYDDSRLQATLADDLKRVAQPAIELTAPGGNYFMNTIMALGVLLLGREGAAREKAQKELARLLPLIAQQASPEGQHYGEVMLTINAPQGKAADQRTATPHLWEGSLFYLSAIAAEDPKALLAYEDALPPSQVKHLEACDPLKGCPQQKKDPPPQTGGCCQTGQGQHNKTNALLLLAFFLAALLWRRLQSS